MSGTCSHRADSSKRCTSSTLVTTQMLTQMLLATVSLCVLCETAVRSRPCAQLLLQCAHCHVLLDGVESELQPARAQLSAKSAEAWHQKSIIECSFRLSKVLYPH